MTRLEPLTADTAVGAGCELLGDLEARHGQVGVMVRTMAHSPAVLGGYLDLSRATKRAKLDRRISERISIAVQTQLGCSMCLQAHVDAARGLGLDEIEIDYARHGTSGDQAIAAIVGYGLGVYRNPAAVTDDQVEVLGHYGYRDREIADVVGVVALNVLTGTFNLTAGLSDPLGRAPVSTGRVGAGRVGAAAPPTVHPTEASKATDGHRHPTPSNDAPEHSRPTAWRAERTGNR